MTTSIEVAWRRMLHRSGSSVVVPPGGPLVVGERHTRLVGLDPGTGDLRWDVGGVGAARTVDDTGRHVLTQGGHGALHLVDVADGGRRWSVRSTRFHDLLTVVGGVVVTGGWRGYEPVRGLDLRDGSELWRHGGVVDDGLVAPLALPRGVLTGRVTAPDLLLLDPRTGETTARWDLPAPALAGDLEPCPFVPGDDGSVVVACQDGSVVRLDPAGSATVVWRHPEPLYRFTAPMLVGDRLWLPEAHGNVAVVDLSTARVVARVATAEPVATLVPVGAGDVLVVGRSGLVTRVDPDGTERARTTVPRHPDRAVSGAPGVVHVAGHGHLTALRVPAAVPG